MPVTLQEGSTGATKIAAKRCWLFSFARYPQQQFLAAQPGLRPGLEDDDKQIKRQHPTWPRRSSLSIASQKCLRRYVYSSPLSHNPSSHKEHPANVPTNSSTRSSPPSSTTPTPQAPTTPKA